MEELILTGRLLPGKRLPPERELASLFEVSRPVVHEGLLILESRGLVRMRPRHGVVVRDYRQTGTLELLLTLLNQEGHDMGPGLTGDLEHLRIQMEQDMVHLICSADDSPEEELDELSRLNDRMRMAESPREVADLDFQFHLTLALASGNAVYALLMNTLKPAHNHLLTRFYEVSGRVDQACDYHDRLITLLRKKDTGALAILINAADSYAGYR